MINLKELIENQASFCLDLICEREENLKNEIKDEIETLTRFVCSGKGFPTPEQIGAITKINSYYHNHCANNKFNENEFIAAKESAILEYLCNCIC